MIAEVSKALKAYEALDTVGKKLFRGELGLVRPQQARGRKRRLRPVAGLATADTAVPKARRHKPIDVIFPLEPQLTV